MGINICLVVGFILVISAILILQRKRRSENIVHQEVGWRQAPKREVRRPPKREVRRPQQSKSLRESPTPRDSMDNMDNMDLCTYLSRAYTIH